MKLDVCIPYLRNYSHELEWSIKSLKNTECGQVYVLGQAPDYAIDAKVITPQVPPMWARMSPYNDVLYKHLTAAQMDISEDIVFMQDDIFLLDKWDGTIYHRGDISEHINERKFDTYTQMLQRTRDWLVSNGYGTKDYTAHTPMIYNRKKLKELIYRILPIAQQGLSMSIRTLYGNVYDVPSENMTIDTKNPTDYYGRAILSTTEESFNGEIGLYIRNVLSKDEPKKPIVHMIWLGSDLPEKYRGNIRTYESHGYKVKLWTEPMKGMRHIKLFNAMKTWAGKADILRLEILYKYGGIYTDTDSRMLAPLPITSDLVCMTSASGYIANETIYAKKRHPALKQALDSLEDNLDTLLDRGMCNIWEICGATYITPIFVNYPHTKLPFSDIGSYKKRPQIIQHSYDGSWSEGQSKSIPRPISHWLDLNILKGE